MARKAYLWHDDIHGFVLKDENQYVLVDAEVGDIESIDDIDAEGWALLENQARELGFELEDDE
ncbi:MAG: hypothetical protein LBN34_00845 [Clostridiales Family XIII bacterium]|jgi:hypothetical protein|nr:hypothetical protein [Clostridiales Family XIII bacterium]